METVTINGKEFKVKYTLRSMFIFEQIKGCAFQVTTYMDNILFLYCIILASNKDIELTFDEFLDAIDADATLVQKISECFQKEAPVNQLLETGKGKKKR
nr:MAG TPA: tail assembly chaperone [Caudoviricetes sp.]